MKTFLRREFLLRALAACSVPLLGPIGSVEGAQKAQPGHAAETALSYFGGDAEAVRVVGEVYLRSLGRDTSAESILVAARGALDVIDRSKNQQTAIGGLQRAVRLDFREGRSVQLEGWVLSRTEAELSALTLLPTMN